MLRLIRQCTYLQHWKAADPTVEGSILQSPNTVAELWGSWPLLTGVLETLQNDWKKTVDQDDTPL